MLYRELARNEAPGPRGERPAVLAVVLYNGTARWTAAVEVTELLGPAEASLAPYQPSQRYLVVDEQHLEADDLPSHNLMTAVVRLEQSRSQADLVGVLQALREWRRAGDDELMQVFADWVRRLTEEFKPKGAPALAPGLTLEEVEMTLVERVRQWPEQWMQEGREQGLEQGLAQGLVKGREQGRGEGLERGREQGLAQGREQGLAQGLEQGLEQGRDEGLEHERALLRRMTAAPLRGGGRGARVGDAGAHRGPGAPRRGRRVARAVRYRTGVPRPGGHAAGRPEPARRLSGIRRGPPSRLPAVSRPSFGAPAGLQCSGTASTPAGLQSRPGFGPGRASVSQLRRLGPKKTKVARGRTGRPPAGTATRRPRSRRGELPSGAGRWTRRGAGAPRFGGNGDIIAGPGPTRCVAEPAYSGGVHDAHYKRLFAFPRMVEDLLRGFVGGRWVKGLDFSTLSKLSSEYVGEDHHRRVGDAVWRVGPREGGRAVLVLLEFQSRVDAQMGLRLLEYTAMLYRELARNEAPGPRGERPAVLAVVLYNGTARWTAAVEVTELLGPAEASLAPYQPSQRYLVVDEQHLGADDLPSHNLMSAVVRLEQSRSQADLVGVLQALREWRRAGDDELMQVFADWVRRLTEEFKPKGAPALAPGLTLEEVEMTLVERVRQWPEQWMQEGREQGIAQGLVQGREQGRGEGLERGREQGLEQGRDEGLEHERALLRRMTAARFGEAAAERVSGMLARIADPERLAEAGVWLVRCDTAQAFLDRVGALPADPSPRND